MKLRVLATACFVLLTGIVAGCDSPVAEVREPQVLDGWVLADWIDEHGTVIEVTVPTCGGDPQATVEETRTTVTITVISTERDPRDGCQDGIQVQLDEPLGDRDVIDGTTGKTF